MSNMKLKKNISMRCCVATLYIVSSCLGFTPNSDYRCHSSNGKMKTGIIRSQYNEPIYGSDLGSNRCKQESYHNWALLMSTKLKSSDENGTTNSTSELSSRVENLFPRAELITAVLVQHAPLGCTVEESLYQDDDYIFISKLTKNGNAEGAGLRLGDVIVGVTGLFGKLECTIDADVEKIKRLVSAVPDEEPLTIQVVRGTNVLERHESTIVELCSVAGASDKEVQECVVDFLAGGYDYENDDTEESDKDVEESLCDDEEDAECLIDDMMNLWADELPTSSSATKTTVTTEQTEKKTIKPKPWSSRSSPSGTWVRDPKTGKMRNIDA